MPIYPTVCAAGHKGEILARVSECTSLKCPECGAPAQQDYAAKNIANGNRQFTGQTQESQTEWYHSTEVKEARAELGKSGSCVQNDGTVKFKDRGQQRQYLKDKAAMKRKFQEGAAVKKAIESKRPPASMAAQIQ